MLFGLKEKWRNKNIKRYNLLLQNGADKKKKDDVLGLAIPTRLFIGMGIGFLTGQLVAGMFIGLGVGFLFFMIAQLPKKK